MSVLTRTCAGPFLVYPKIRTVWFCHILLSNDADGMANSVDPDQTAPENPCSFWSSRNWVYTCLYRPVCPKALIIIVLFLICPIEEIYTGRLELIFYIFIITCYKGLAFHFHSCLNNLFLITFMHFPVS